MNEIIFSLIIGGWISFLGIFLYWYLDKEDKNNRTGGKRR